MSERVWPGTYRDARGTEAIAFHTDGKVLRVRIRGVDFEGDDFDMLTVVGDARAALDAGLTLEVGALWDCELGCELPLTVGTPGATEPGLLRMCRVLRRDATRGLTLELRFRGQAFTSAGRSGGYFEDELLDIQRQLPPGVYLRACLLCAFSSYNPYGHPCFGALGCFRGNKQELLEARAREKEEPWALLPVWKTRTEDVQETHLCPEFELRLPDAQ